VEVQTDVPKKPFYKKKWFLITLGVLVVIALIPKGNNVDPITSSPSDSLKNEVSKDKPSLESRLTKEIESIKKGVDFSSYKGEIASLQLATVLFTAWGEIVREGLKSSNPNDVKLANELKKLVSKTQVRELPEIRKNYIEIARTKLWENNITVSGGGKGNTIINLTGGSFFNNKNKSDVQGTLSSILNDFRFKKANYRAYGGQDEYTYYDIDSPDDGELY
jgi:hypothetical protein